ncbi:MAG TPA: hypothetical protein DIS87_05370 [Armatimonadetes bacterium]|nr:hypothetical protein [Armatimonadota bacterium]
MVSIAFIEDFIANFVFDRIVNEIDSSSFLSSFMAHVESSIEEFEFWFPISGANGNVEFAFGGCKIAPTCPNFDVFLNAMESGKEENRDRAGAFDNKVQVLRRNYGKCLWIAVPQTGELKYASQSAYEKSLEICDILRAFIVESYRPDRFATLIPGRPYSVGDFSISQTQNGFSVHESVLPGSEIIWFDQKRLRDLKSLGLYLIDEPVKAERKTGFDRVLLRTLELMGNGVGQQSTAQKVVLLCAALEFLFCDKQGEAIVATMPKRAAMLIGANLDDRKRIVQTIKMAYNDRSRSVHTGGKVAVAEHTFDFLRLCFTLTAFLPRLIGQFESKEKFIQALEDRQLA